MIMNDDLIFDDDEFLDDDDEFVSEPEPQTQEPSIEDDLTTEVLRLKGIEDPEKIKFEDESGAIIERSWNSLTREEQVNILGGIETVKQNDLSDDEAALLQSIRESGLSVNEYMLRATDVTPQNPSLDIDKLTDEEVYALDLIDKVEDITDEELSEAIENAKRNEALFKRTVEGLRKEYTQLEQDEKAQKANLEAAKQQEAYQKFADSIQNEIQNLNSFAGNDLELSQEDVDDLASFMLDLDDSGVSAFGKALQDPTLFTKAAFWLLNEEQIVEELSKQMQETYKRGYEAGKQDNSRMVIAPINKKPKKEDDFFIDDEEW